MNCSTPGFCSQDLNSSSVQFSLSVVSNSLRPQGLQHVRPPCLSPTLWVYSNSYPLSWWCHPTISSSVVPFSSCLQSFPASGSFPMSQLFASGGQSIGLSASASVLPMNTQNWCLLGWTGWISLQSKGLSCLIPKSKFVFFNILAQEEINWLLISRLSYMYSVVCPAVERHIKIFSKKLQYQNSLR